MARQNLDTTGNESDGSLWARLNTMLTELYAGAISSLTVDSGTKTASATTGAATLSKNSGKITSEALTTAAGASYTLTLTNTEIAATSLIFASVGDGTNTQGTPVVGPINAGAGSATIEIKNDHASEALNGTITIDFLVLGA